MRARGYIVVGIIAVVATTALVAARLMRRPAPPKYVTAPVALGRVSRSVLTTGTLEPLTTVQVGTQVSGTIASVLVDFNTLVKKGQVLARIDPATFDAALQAARDALVDAQAQLTLANTAASDAHVKLTQAEQLFKTQEIAEADFATAQATAREADDQVNVANAQVAAAKAQVEQAAVNLDHTVIRSPVDGIVVSRNVDPGQTVAASVQTPILFVVAPDLKKMQVEATIDEADVGGVHAGDVARFTVESYPDATFEGTVSVVRLEPLDESANASSGGEKSAAAAVGTSAANNAAAPQSTGSVVAYTAVIGVDNPTEQLRPGMTAVIMLPGTTKDDVLRVPNAALSFHPPGAAPPASGAHNGTVWVMDGSGKLRAVMIQTGLSDERFTEVSGGNIHSGDRVVTSIAAAAR